MLTNTTKAYLAAAAALILWGGTAVATKIAVVAIDGLTVGALRSLMAGCLALIAVLVTRTQFPETRRDQLLLVVSGVTGFAVWPMLMSLGIAKTTAGHAALIMTILPVLTVLISATIHRRLPRAGWWVGSIVALAGSAFLIATVQSQTAGDVYTSSITGDLIVFGGCFLCAAGYVAGGTLATDYGALPTTLWGLTVALIVLVPAMIWLAPATEWSVVPVSGWLAIGWLAICSSFLGYLLWYYALGKGGIARIGSWQLLMPVISLIAAPIFLGELLTPPLLLVGAVIIVGTYIAQRNPLPLEETQRNEVDRR